MNPLVSIIIPVYNAEKYVAEAIDSALKQTYKNIEIIIVNDGSTDGTSNIIDNLILIDNRIKRIDQINKGSLFARKVGVENASGDYIFFLDGDDTIPLDALENLYIKSDMGSIDIVAGNVNLIRSDASIRLIDFSAFGVGNGIKFLEFILVEKLHYSVGKLIKRTIFFNNTIEMNEGVVVGEDQLLLCQIGMFTSKVVTINSVVYNYLINIDSVTQRKIENITFSSRQEVYAKELFELLKRFDYNSIIRQQIYLRILSALYLALHRSGRFVNELISKMVLRKTLDRVLFSEQKILLTHFPLILRSFVSLIMPSLAYRLRNINK